MITHISPSMIDTWGRCPEQFRRIYVEGERRPPGIALHIGSGTHKGIEVNHRAKVITHKDEPLDVLQDAARDAYVSRVRELIYFPPDELSGAKNAIAQGVDTTVKLVKLYYDSLAPKVQPIMVEEHLSIDDPDMPFPVVGIPDTQAKKGWHLEVKTAEKKWPLAKAETSVQPTIYRELLKAHKSAPKRQTIEILTKSKYEHQSIEVIRIDEDWTALKLRINAMLRAINAGIFMPAPPDSWACSGKFCGFFWTCAFIAPHKKVWRRA